MPHLELCLLLQYPVLCWPLPWGPETRGLLRVCQNAVSSERGRHAEKARCAAALRWNADSSESRALVKHSHPWENGGRPCSTYTSVAVGIVFISLLCVIYIAVYKGSRRHGNLCFFLSGDVSCRCVGLCSNLRVLWGDISEFTHRGRRSRQSRSGRSSGFPGGPCSTHTLPTSFLAPLALKVLHLWLLFSWMYI